MTAPDPDRVRELIAEAQSLITAMDGVWKETPAVKLVSLMARDGSALLDLAEAGLAAQDERDDDESLRDRMAGLLDGVALAIHGEPDPDTAHSWHDLPELTRAAQQRIAKLEKIIEVKDYALDRYGFCPDCRDKVEHGECQRCRAQVAERKLEAAQERIAELESETRGHTTLEDALGYIHALERRALQERIAALEAELAQLQGTYEAKR